MRGLCALSHWIGTKALGRSCRCGGRGVSAGEHSTVAVAVAVAVQLAGSG